MTEKPEEGGIENNGENIQNNQNNLTDKVSFNILKLFFEKSRDHESDENVEQEINIDIKGSFKGPDKFGNYVLSFGNKRILLNGQMEDLTGLEFVSIMPYNDRYYVCDVGKKCVFFDTQTGNIVEFAEVGGKFKPKIYGKDELCDDEFLSDLCDKSIMLFPGEHNKTLLVGFYGFLQKYHSSIRGKDVDIETKMQESTKFGKEYEAIFSFLMGAYKYMYDGKITNLLAGKDGKIWKDLKDSELLKETYPDLYLTMNELDFVKNVLVDRNGDVCGYVIVKNGVCSYVQSDGTVSQYDDFIGPDEYGNIITRQGNKKYFMNQNFQYPFCGFDEIIGPDKNGNYILRIKNKLCLVSVHTGKILSLSSGDSTGNEPNFTTECFDGIQGPDQNDNYKIKCSKGYFLANSKGEKITDTYLNLELIPELGNYKVFNMSGTATLDAKGQKI